MMVERLLAHSIIFDEAARLHRTSMLRASLGRLAENCLKLALLMASQVEIRCVNLKSPPSASCTRGAPSAARTCGFHNLSPTVKINTSVRLNARAAATSRSEL